MKRKIKWNIIIFVLSILLELLLFSTLLIITRDSVIEEANSNIIELTEKSSQDLSFNMEKKQLELQAIAQKYRENDQEFSGTLKNIIAAYGAIDIAASDNQGRSLFKQDENKHVTYYKPFYDGKSHVSNPYYGIGGTLQITVEVPLWDNEKHIGALYASYPANYFLQERSQYFYNKSGIACVIEKSGKNIFPIPKQEQYDLSRNILDILNTENNDTKNLKSFYSYIESDETGTARLNVDGTKSFLSVMSIKDTGWKMLVIIPEFVLIKNMKILSNLILAVIIFFAFSIWLHVYLRIKLLSNYDKDIITVKTIDSLTGVNNLYGFCEAVKKYIEENPSITYAIMYCDIKQFRYINDNYGFDIGDAVLLHVSNSIKENPTNIIYARISGDTFLIFFTYRTHLDIQRHFESMESVICDISHIVPDKIRLVWHGGVYCLGDVTKSNTQVRDMIDRANDANKEARVNPESFMVIYTERMMERKKEEIILENQMEKALVNGEFIVYLQPKILLSDNSIHGAEALVRWNHPTKGIIPPGRFISLFEKNGFIQKLDIYMMEQCCILLSRWISEGKKCPCISVNVSRKLMINDQFLYDYLDLKRKYNIPDNMIELEFTESLVLDNTERIKEVLLFLRGNGFICSIDDFGSGYSSLNMLKDIPADVLKLDRVFFERGLETYRECTVIKYIIGMAKELSMTIVAEGIERMDTVEFLKDNDCDIVQGYVFAEPMPVKEFEELVDEDIFLNV